MHKGASRIHTVLPSRSFYATSQCIGADSGVTSARDKDVDEYGVFSDPLTQILLTPNSDPNCAQDSSVLQHLKTNHARADGIDLRDPRPRSGDWRAVSGYEFEAEGSLKFDEADKRKAD